MLRLAVRIAFVSFSFIGLLATGLVEAQDGNPIVGASVRVRYELQDNFNQKYYGTSPVRGSSDDGFAVGRFRVGLDCHPVEKVRFALYGQHAVRWDMALEDDAYYNRKLGMRHDPNRDYWELSDTYLEIRKPFDVPVVVRGGRQRLAYGNKRVFGPGTWGNSGKWIWDAIRLSWKFEGGFFDTFYGMTMVHEPVRFSLSHRHFYESYGFYGHYALTDNWFGLVLEPFVMTKIDAHDNYTGEDGMSGDLNTYYAGGRSYVKNLRGIDADVTYVKQTGEYGTDDLRASAYHLHLAYNIRKTDIRPRVGVGYTYGSGDSDPDDGVRETFDAAFGSRAKTYGRMNLFQWQNMKDAEVSIEVRPWKWCYIKSEFHRFQLAEERDGWSLNSKEYRDKTGKAGDQVGREFDITAVLNLPAGGELQAGFGHFWPDGFAKSEASDAEANWVFLQWTLDLSRGVP